MMNSVTIRQALEFIGLLSTSPSNPYNLCNTFGIEVIDNEPINKDGYLVCDRGCKLIFVSSNITNRHRKKFIISHELGHFLLHREKLYCCTDISEIGISQINSNCQENEANYFASEYLLPQEQLLRMLPHESIRFSDIFKIAAHFDVSATMAAMKATRLSNAEDEILLCYKGQQLKWFSSGDTGLCYKMLPQKCPVDLTRAPLEVDIGGVWDTLYEGTVHQEVFNPFEDQRLVLLSGTRCL